MPGSTVIERDVKIPMLLLVYCNEEHESSCSHSALNLRSRMMPAKAGLLWIQLYSYCKKEGIKFGFNFEFLRSATSLIKSSTDFQFSLSTA